MWRLLVPLLLALASACQNDIAEGAESPEPAFDVSRDRVELLPFRVRLARVAQVAGVATDDPLLAELNARHTELGDHDYSSGVPANLSWTASRMSSWVKALMPVCQAESFRALYPALGDDPSALIAAAWGRPATEADLAAVSDGLTGTGIDTEERTQAVCLAVLSSLEFVAR